MDKTILEKNLEAMDKWYPDFADAIRNKEYKEEDGVEVITERSLDGELIFKVVKDSKTRYLNGKREANKFVDALMESMGEIHKYAPVILLGAGNGASLKRIINETDSTVTIAVCEPSINIFIKMLEEVDLSKELADRPVGFVVDGLNGSILPGVISKLVTVETLEFTKVAVYPNYNHLYDVKIRDALKFIQKVTDALIVNAITWAKMVSFLSRNIICNLPYVCAGYNTKSLLKIVPPGGVAILVSAGPSLNKNINELKKAKNKAFIVAVDTAVKPLIKAGVIPDVYVTVDAGKPLDLVEVDIARDIPLVTPVVANCEILEYHRGKKFFFDDSYKIPHKIYSAQGQTMPGAAGGGSVATNAFSMLFKLCFETIILVGQDLAYENGRSHADGTFHDVMPEEKTDGLPRVKGNYEDLVVTREDFKMYLTWFNDCIGDMKKNVPGFTVVNATAGGAYIKGTELMSLSDAIDKYCKEEYNYEEKIRELEPDFTPEQQKNAMDMVRGIPDSFARINAEAKKLYNVYVKIGKMNKAHSVNRDEYNRQLKRIKSINKKCESEFAFELVTEALMSSSYIIQSESLMEKDNVEDELATIVKQGMVYAKQVQECTTLLEAYAREHIPMED